MCVIYSYRQVIREEQVLAITECERWVSFVDSLGVDSAVPARFNPFPAFKTSYEVFGKVHSMQFVCCYTMLNANFLHKFQPLVHSEESRFLRKSISGLFNISLRQLLNETSISRVNDLAGKGLSDYSGPVFL